MKTYKEHRWENNPQEKKFVEEFKSQHSSNDDMDLIVFGHSPEIMIPKDYLTDKEKDIVLSTIQWLGSPVGQGFLRSCGFVKKEDL